MKRYTVVVSHSARDAIAAHARFIAIENAAPNDAQTWVTRVWDAMDSLECWPKRASRAREDEHFEQVLLQLVVGSHRVVFSVDDEARVVRVLAVRHSAQNEIDASGND